VLAQPARAVDRPSVTAAAEHGDDGRWWRRPETMRVARGSARDVFALSGGGLMVVVAASETRRCSGAAAVWRWGDGGATSFVAGRQS
jgi:hypothetical protein